jgi:hypothetical protein
MALSEVATTGVDERRTLRADANRAARPWFRTSAQIFRELLIVGAFCTLYEILRTDVVQDGAQAAAHSLSVVHLETQLGIFHEAAIQGLFLRVPDVVKFFNLYYGGTHFLVPAIALSWLVLRHRESYARARTALAVSTGVGFLIFWLFPVAPPRLLPSRFGIIDTLVTFHQSGHLEHSLIDSAGDIYAALPSLHVAWALWCTLVLYPVVRRRSVRVVLVAYPILTTLVVVTTGNHFFLDAAAGSLLVTLVWFALPKAADLRRHLLHDTGPVRLLARKRFSAVFGSAPLNALPLLHPVDAERKAADRYNYVGDGAGHRPVGFGFDGYGHPFPVPVAAPIPHRRRRDTLDPLGEGADGERDGPHDGSPAHTKTPFRSRT